jgi:hypothetical protein
MLTIVNYITNGYFYINHIAKLKIACASMYGFQILLIKLIAQQLIKLARKRLKFLLSMI